MQVTNKLKGKVLDWLQSGEVGMSSKYMAYTAINKDCEYAHPHDPADLLRCIKLIQEIPEIDYLKKKLLGKSKQWDSLLKDWDHLVARVNLEASMGNRAPITYRAMKDMGC